MATENLISTNIAAQDVLNERLTQALAVLFSLECHGIDDNKFSIPHDSVMGSIWAVRSLLEEAQRAAGRVTMQGLKAA